MPTKSTRHPFLIACLVAPLLTAPLLADGAVGYSDVPQQEGHIRLALQEELGASWGEIFVARLVTRSTERQRSHLPREKAAERAELDLALEEGCSLVLADLGPASQRRVTHTTKIVSCRAASSPRKALEERAAAASITTAKTGAQIEIRPLRSPTLIAPGSDLPVVVYFEGVPQTGAEVIALSPGGKPQVKRTDSVGSTWFRVAKSGRFAVRYRTERDGTAYLAELLFDVAPAELFEAMPPLLTTLRSAAPAAKSGRARQKEGEWRELGPAPLVSVGARNTGRASGIATSRTRANRYYVGAASGGVWESVNGGGAWTPLNGSLPILSIGAIAVDPRNDKVIYAGSGEANGAYHSLYGLGLYRTFNRGRTWRVLAPELFAGRTFSRLVVSPHDNRVIWAAVGRAGGTFEGFEGAREHPKGEGRLGLFRSRDRGVTWRHLRAANGLAALAMSDLDLDPIDANRVYAAIGDAFGRNLNGVYRSSDGGESFEPVLTSQTEGLAFGRVTVAVAPSAPDRVYALITNPTSRAVPGGFSPGGASLLGLYRSDDGGSSWTRFTPSNFMAQQGNYNSTLIVAPQDPDTIFLGGVQMLRSSDGGQTFIDVTPVHVDQHDLTFDAAGRLLAANDGGVNRSSDLGLTWITRNEGLGVVQIYPGLSLHPTDPDVVLAGMQDNGTNLRFSDTRQWTSIFGGDGGYTAIHPENPDILFVEFQGTGNLFRSQNGGLSFTAADTGIAQNDRNCFLPPFVIDPADPNRMLYATQRIYESTDGGTTWRPISGDLTGGAPWAIHSLIIAPSDSNVVYAKTNDGRVLVSQNGGTAWDLVLEGVAAWPRVTRQIGVDPARPSQAYVADMGFGGAKLLATLNRGRTWLETGGGLPDVPVNTVAVHRNGRNRRFVFVGTDTGVFLSRNFGATWEPYGTLENTPVMDLVVDPRHDRLVASTLGRGAWSIALP